MPSNNYTPSLEPLSPPRQPFVWRFTVFKWVFSLVILVQTSQNSFSASRNKFKLHTRTGWKNLSLLWRKGAIIIHAQDNITDCNVSKVTTDHSFNYNLNHGHKSCINITDNTIVRRTRFQQSFLMKYFLHSTILESEQYISEITGT